MNSAANHSARAREDYDYALAYLDRPHDMENPPNFLEYEAHLDQLGEEDDVLTTLGRKGAYDGAVTNWQGVREDWRRWMFAKGVQTILSMKSHLNPIWSVVNTSAHTRADGGTFDPHSKKFYTLLVEICQAIAPVGEAQTDTNTLIDAAQPFL